MTEPMSDLAKDILAGLEDAVAHAEGRPSKARVTRYEFADAKAIRETVGMSQAGFARAYGIPLDSLQNWEQRRTHPDRTASAYLLAIAALPQEIAAARHRTDERVGANL